MKQKTLLNPEFKKIAQEKIDKDEADRETRFEQIRQRILREDNEREELNK
jgi:hypothetical protein